MFRDIVQPSIRVGSRKGFVLPLSVVTHVAVVGAALLVSLTVPGVLPIPAEALKAFVSGDVTLPPEPPPAPRSSVPVHKSMVDVDPNAAPLEAPDAIAPEVIVDIPVAPVGTVQGIASLAGVIRQDAVPVPSVSPPPPVATDAPLPVGGNIKPPVKIKDVRPVYPPFAQAAHIEGVVIIETMIGTTGKVLDARVLRSIPLLDDAALQAVRQWEFTPTLLNGSPVTVMMTVTVNFSLK
jgi:periplasmic protein TonB